MSSAPSVVWLDGELVPSAQARVPVEDRGLQFGESLYEVVPITAGRARALPEHAARMRSAAEQIGLAGAPDAAQWQRIVDALQTAQPLREALLYAQLTGGCAPRAHVPAARPPPTLIAYHRAHRYPDAAAVAAGIRAITVPDLRWARCDLKTTMLLPAVLAKHEAARRGADEALMIGDDEVHEGASSNVFVVEAGAVIGVPQSPAILPGVTRALLGRACDALGVELRAEPISLRRLGSADEVFVTSTSRLVMPVLAIDDAPVASGRAGAIASALATRMRRDLELEE